MRRRGIEIPPQREQTEADVLRSRLFRISVQGEQKPGEASELIREFVQKRQNDIGATYSEVLGVNTMSASAKAEFEKEFLQSSEALAQIESTPLTLETMAALHERIDAADALVESYKERYGNAERSMSAPLASPSIQEVPTSTSPDDMKAESASLNSSTEPEEQSISTPELDEVIPESSTDQTSTQEESAPIIDTPQVSNENRYPGPGEIEDAEIVPDTLRLTYQGSAESADPQVLSEARRERIATLRAAIAVAEAEAKRDPKQEDKLLQLENELRTEEREQYSEDKRSQASTAIAESRERIRLLEEQAKRNPNLEGELLLEEERLRALERHSKGEDTPSSEDVIESNPIASDATPAELRQNMRRNLEEMERMTAQSESTDQARDAYFAALQSYQQGRSGVSVASESLLGERMPEELKELRRAWIQERAEFARTQQESAEARLSVRTRTREEVLDGLQKHKGKESLDKEAVLERYRRMVTERSVVLGAEEQENQVRINALSEREKGITDRLMERYRALPPGVRIMGTSALLVGGGALLTSTGVGLAALALGGTSAALRVFAEKQKDSNPKVSKFMGAISRLTSLAGLAGLVSETAVRGTHDILGTERKAAESLTSRDHGDLTDWENLEKVSAERKSAIGAREGIERQSRWARIVGSLTGGALLGSTISSGAEAADGSAVQSGSGGESATPSEGASELPPVSNGGSVAESGVGVVSDQPSTGSEGIQMAVGATIHESGQGTDQLFMELKQNIAERGLFTGSESPALKFLTESSPNDISRAMDDFGTRGIVTQIGDQFFVGEDQNVYFQSANGDPQLFIQNTPGNEGGITIHKLDTQALGAVAPTAPEAPVPPVPQTPEVTAVPSPEPQPTIPSDSPVEGSTQPSAEPATPDLPTPPQSVESAAPVENPEPPPTPDPLPMTEQAPTTTDSSSLESETTQTEVPTEQAPAQPSSAAELITSKFGVEVNPSEPAVYTYLDAKGKEVTAIFGGSSPDRFLAAQEYLEKNPGSTLRLQLEEKDLATGAVLRTPVVEWSSTENGVIQMSPSADFEGKNALQAPDPQQFTKKLPFTLSR